MANKSKLSDMARGATEVNLRYTATLLTLSKDYLRALSDSLMTNLNDEEPDIAGQRTTRNRPKSAPLIVAGRKGEVGNAAFSISNTSGRDGSVTVSCRGDFGGAKVWTDPQKLSLKNGDQATLRILAEFDNSIPVGEDQPGNVYLPELNMQVAEFVIRRLPDPAKTKTRQTKKRKKTTE